MDNLPEEIIDKINDFRIGDDIHWKNKFNYVVNELNNVEFFCKISDTCSGITVGKALRMQEVLKVP